MLTHIVWALYLYIGVWAFGDASENVNKVNSPRFFIVFSTALSDYENNQNDKKTTSKTNYNEDTTIYRHGTDSHHTDHWFHRLFK